MAQAYLRPVDDYLSRLPRSFQGRISVTRWMDDIWLFADDRRLLDTSFRELTSILDQLGLEFNSDKTKWLDTKDSEFSLMVTASGDEDEVNVEASKAAIAERVAEILKNAEEVPRSSFGLLKMEAFDGQLNLLESIEQKLDNFPHIADFVAKAILMTERWQLHEEWYVKYLDSQVSPTNWSVEAWAAMFPAQAERQPHKVADAFIEKLGKSLQTTVLPLSCHRLSKWRPPQALEAFARSATSLSTPYELRSLALATLSAGGSEDFVAECLGAYVDTSFLVEMIKDRDHQPFNDPISTESR